MSLDLESTVDPIRSGTPHELQHDGDVEKAYVYYLLYATTHSNELSSLPIGRSVVQ